MLVSNAGKYVQISDCGKYVLVVYSKPKGYPGDDHAIYVVKAVGRLQQRGPFVFSPLEPSQSGQREYYGNLPSPEVCRKYDSPNELIHYDAILQGYTLWKHAAGFIRDGKTNQRVEFSNFPEQCPIVDGEGWNSIQCWRNSARTLHYRETPTYNKDIKWNHFASKTGEFPFHFAYWGYESHDCEKPTLGFNALVGHMLERYQEYFQISEMLQADPTLREELRA